MSFAWPQLLWLLFLPAALLAWDVAHRRRATAATRPKILRAEAGVRSLTLSGFETRPAAPNSRPRWWLGAGLALALVALARPQWGRLDEPVFDQSREILLAIDLSRSMLSTDVRPSRLERAKLLVQSLLEKLAGERVGLVVFSGTAFLQSPLSADYEILREFLPALGPDFLPEGGTNYRSLIDTSLGAFSGSPSADRFLVVLSDGEATDDDWKPRVEELKAKGIRVIGLGVGTALGSMIPDGAGGLIKDERGAVVMSKLESATLQELAQVTGGVYRDASTWVDLAELVKETVDTGRKGKFVEKNTVRLVERFQWPLAFGLWCLLVSFCFEFPVRPRPRAIALRPQGDRRPAASTRPAGASAAAALPVLGLVALSSIFPPAAHAAVTISPPQNAPTQNAPLQRAVVPNAPPPPSALAKIVGRLAGADDRTAGDWAELGHETVTWGSELRFQQRPVPEGPVRDALNAVDLGSKLDSKATDWPKLREELEELLKKPDENKQQKDGDQQQKDKNQQSQDSNDQDQKSPGQNQSGDQKSQSQDQTNTKPQDQQQTPKPTDQKNSPGDSAFGEMKPKDQPPPPPPTGEMQKVGGAKENASEAKEPMDPALALPMQRLDQLRDQDSPAQLFQLMEGERAPVKKPAKDW